MVEKTRILVQNLNHPTQAATTLSRPAVQENEIKIYAALIWRWLWLILLCMVLGGVGAFVTSRLSTPIYQAGSTLLINEARGASTNYQDILTSERLSRTYAEMIGQRAVREETAAQLGIPMDLFDQDVTDLRVATVRDTQLLRITVEGASPQLVAAVANTLPQIFIDRLQNIQSARYATSKQNLQNQLQILDASIEQTQAALDAIGIAQNAQERTEQERLQNLLAQTQNSYATLLARFEDLRLVEAQSVDSITIVERASEPLSPIRPRTMTNTLLAAIVGAMLALGVVFLIEYLDDRIRSPEELTRALDTAWMGAIAQIPGVKPGQWSPAQLIAQREPRHPVVEAFRRLRTNLQFSQVDTGLRSLMVTSANPGDGKSINAANLAIVMAQAGHSVVLVDADLRRPVQHKIFDLPAAPGLTDALLEADDALSFVWETETPNLRLMPCGKRAPNPAELVGSARMQALLARLQTVAEVVILDAPPVMAVADAQILGRQVEGVLLVIDARSTSRAAASRAADALRQVGANLLGAVVNRLDRGSRGYGDYSYQYYYYSEGGEENSPQRNGHERTQTAKVKGA